MKWFSFTPSIRSDKNTIIFSFLKLLFVKRSNFLSESSKAEKEESISDSGEESDRESGETTVETASSQIYRPARRGSLPASIPKQYHYGSFYLRMGAVGTNLHE